MSSLQQVTFVTQWIPLLLVSEGLPELVSIATWIARIGGTTVLVVFGILLYKGKLRFERELIYLAERLVEEQTVKVYWRNMAIKNSEIADGSQQLARDGVNVAKQAANRDDDAEH